MANPEQTGGKPSLVLGLETSCDETAAAVVLREPDGSGRILSNIVRSQWERHRAYGGVVPEIAARAHVECLDVLVREAIREAPTGDPHHGRARHRARERAADVRALDASVAAAAADALRARRARRGRRRRRGHAASRLDFTIQLGMVRGGVEVADVGSIALSRSLAWLGRDDVLVAIDTARYERSIATAVGAGGRGRHPRALTISDSHVSPIARVATWSFQILDTGAGPFDSFVGALALTNLLVSLTRAARPRRPSATSTGSTATGTPPARSAPTRPTSSPARAGPTRIGAQQCPERR